MHVRQGLPLISQFFNPFQDTQRPLEGRGVPVKGFKRYEKSLSHVQRLTI